MFTLSVKFVKAKPIGLMQTIMNIFSFLSLIFSLVAGENFAERFRNREL